MLTVQDLRLRYRTDQGEVEAVKGLSLNVDRGEFYTLLGPSGCGKTTTLRCIAGLETPENGLIQIDSTVVYSSAAHTVVPAHRRNTGMVFQSYAIWPHMSVFDNVAFPLQHGAHKWPRAAVREKVMRALELVQLADYASRPAPMLSGGQQQRVALARAVASEPSLLLLDEPLSNLDARLREDMRTEIKALVARLGITTVYVTHDQLEALSMSDRVALLNAGRIVQEGAPREMYLQPADAFAANFLGRTNLLEGTVTDVEADAGVVQTRYGSLRCTLPAGVARGAEVTVGFRPESAELAASGDGLAGTVVALSFVGEAIEYQVDLGGQTVRVKVAPFQQWREGQGVVLRIPAERVYLLNR